MQKLCEDYALDLKLDGQGKSGLILHGGTQVSDQTLTLDLSNSLEAYLKSDFTDIDALEGFQIQSLVKPLMAFEGF